MTPSKEAIEAAHNEIDYAWGYQANSTVARRMTEASLKAAYAIDFTALQQENDRLQRENATLRAEHLSNCLFHRCSTHLAMPQINKTEYTGAECGACIAEDRNGIAKASHELLIERDRLQAEVERLEHLNGEAATAIEGFGNRLADALQQLAEQRAEIERLTQISKGEAIAHFLVKALQGILEIGKRDMSNPKYDGHFESARAALAQANAALAAAEGKK